MIFHQVWCWVYERLAWRMIWSYHSQIHLCSAGSQIRFCWLVLKWLTPDTFKPVVAGSLSVAVHPVGKLHLSSSWASVKGAEQECGNWFFVLFTLSPTDVGALSAQFAQICGLVPPSADSRCLPTCWHVCRHGCFFINSLYHSLTRSWPKCISFDGCITPKRMLGSAPKRDSKAALRL